MSSTRNTPTGRLLSLDYLRGFFILVIIIDHLWRFPSAWALFSGEAKLWVTAAEGFVMISGFLIGYVRGYKGLKLSFVTIAKKLFVRSVMLYFWMIIVSIGYLWIEWHNRVPNMPFTKFIPEVEQGDYSAAIMHVISGQPHAWIHFLYLYAIFLMIAIGAVYLFRKRFSWAVGIISVVLYIAGIWLNIEWMKWQLIFFLPSVAGFHFDYIRLRWSQMADPTRHLVKRMLLLAAALTLLASILITYLPSLFPAPIVSTTTDIFLIEHFTAARVLMAILWFIALAFIFEKLTPYIQKYTYGTLEYLGTHSLTAYVAHGYVICLVNFALNISVPASLLIPFNTLLGALALAGVYIIIRLPVIRTVLPR
jgi:hypothetical protein